MCGGRGGCEGDMSFCPLYPHCSDCLQLLSTWVLRKFDERRSYTISYLHTPSQEPTALVCSEEAEEPGHTGQMEPGNTGQKNLGAWGRWSLGTQGR